MADDSANLTLPYILPAQAQKHVTVNEGLRRLDGLVQLAVESRTLASQPGAPAEGALWILPASPSGSDWGAFSAGALAYYRDGAFVEIAAQAGWRAWSKDEGALLVFDGTRWRAAAEAVGEAPFGAATFLRVAEGEATLSGPTTDAPVAIEDRAVVLAVTTRTTEAVTGAASYDCGVPGEANKYGGSLGAAAGSTNSGVTGPTAFYAATPVRLTANGGDFTGGKVRVAIHYLTCRPPTS